QLTNKGETHDTRAIHLVVFAEIAVTDHRDMEFVARSKLIAVIFCLGNSRRRRRSHLGLCPFQCPSCEHDCETYRNQESGSESYKAHNPPLRKAQIEAP